MPDIITILCSGTSFGTYIPALVASQQLQNQGQITEVVVLENILFAERRDNVTNIKFAFHRNFRLALASQKMAKDIMPSIDPERLAQLLGQWKNEGRRRFMAFTGFWVPILQQYLQAVGEETAVSIDICHTDAITSTSWKLYNPTEPAFRHVWFYQLENAQINSYLPITDEAMPLPFEQRNGRFLIHGGGWGVGTYQRKIPALVDKAIQLDVIAYEENDLAEQISTNRYFMIDPKWEPWQKNQRGEHEFPPFGEVQSDGRVTFQNDKPYPLIYDLIRSAPAIISKPGGATLLDSLFAATPLILLEPYGEYEKANAQLWEQRGFGIPYQKWLDTGCSHTILQTMHNNICETRASLPNYIGQHMETDHAQNLS